MQKHSISIFPIFEDDQPVSGTQSSTERHSVLAKTPVRSNRRYEPRFDHLSLAIY